MLELKDFIHLPQLDALIDQLTAEERGLIVVAGLDPRPASQDAPLSFVPSGRSAIFRILMRHILNRRRTLKALVVTDDQEIVRIPRRLRRRIRLLLVEPPLTYTINIDKAIRHHPGLLVIDHLDDETVPAAFDAASSGLLVLAQLNTIFRGADVVDHLRDLGAPQEQLHALLWVLAVGRLATLCPQCKQAAAADSVQLKMIYDRYPLLYGLLEQGEFAQASGCPYCHHSGRSGEVTVFDVWRAGTSAADARGCLPLEGYVAGLAALGHLPLDDAFRVDAEQLRLTYHMLSASERDLAATNAELQRRLAELEAANRVLQGRTEALISLHDIGQALIASHSLHELGRRVCRQTRDLCGADRAILYFQRPHDTVEVLAVYGWEPSLVHQHMGADLVFKTATSGEPQPFYDWPPGIPPRHPDVEGAALRAGLRVPLMAQGVRVGLMIVHTTHKSFFTPGEVALLQTFANQAALAIQRAGLIEQLQEKIAELETAQAELVEKERLEREMELARQVQQSVLPRTFPLIPGYRFGACNQPARRVGGDFYDVILLDGDRFGVVIADVSDKGMPAALYMALTRSLILAEARRLQDPKGSRTSPSPRAVLENVHRLLLELGQPDMFVTVFYGIVDGPARQLTYARAGHDRPLLLRENQMQTLGGEGTFLGFLDLDELHISEEQIDLAAGDKLVLYTDGLTDILSPQGHAFGQGRLEDVLQENASLPPQELCTATFAHLVAYQGTAQQYDDMTMLVVDIQ